MGFRIIGAERSLLAEINNAETRSNVITHFHECFPDKEIPEEVIDAWLMLAEVKASPVKMLSFSSFDIAEVSAKLIRYMMRPATEEADVVLPLAENEIEVERAIAREILKLGENEMGCIVIPKSHQDLVFTVINVLFELFDDDVSNYRDIAIVVERGFGVYDVYAGSVK